MAGSVAAAVSPSDPAVALCLEVGRALKKVDRGLFQEWFDWCGSVLGFNSAIAIWDFFQPMACDVHW